MSVHAPVCFVFALLTTLNVTSGDIPIAEIPETHFPELRDILLKLDSESPLIQEERQRLKEFSANTLIADSQKGFHLGLTFQLQSIHEDRPQESFYQRERFYGSAFLRKPIFHWGALNASSQIASIQENIVAMNLKLVSSDLRTLSRESYLDLIVLRDRLELSAENVKVAETQLEKVQLQKKLRQINDLKVQEARALVLERKVQLEDINRTLRTAISHFGEITGTDPDTLDLDNDQPLENLLNNHEFGLNIPTLIAGSTSINLLKRKQEVEIEKNRVTIAESNLKPKVNIVGGFFQDQVPLSNYEDNFLRNNILIGLEVNWALWDSFKSKGEKLKALATQRRLEMSLERESRAYRLELENMRSQLLSLSKRIEISKELVSVAKNRLKVSEIEFRSDRVTGEQLTDAKIALDLAKISRLESICEYIKIRNRYESALSMNYEQF